MKLVKGDIVSHPVWGIGRVLEHKSSVDVHIHFPHIGEKLLKSRGANLMKVTYENRNTTAIPRKNIDEEMQLLGTLLVSPNAVSQSDRNYLIQFRKQILMSLNELADSIGGIPSIEIPNFAPWTKLISSGTENIEIKKQRLSKFRLLEKRRRQDYWRYKKEYEDIISVISEESENQQNFVNKLIETLQNCVSSKISFNPIKVHWKLLPKGETTFEQIISHFKKVSKHRSDIVIDVERLNKVHSLNPDLIYLGEDEFEGYLTFYFRKSSTAVLECAVSGNAIYVIRENWEELSRLSKFELLNEHSDKVARIIHKGKWFEQLKNALRSHRIRR